MDIVADTLIRLKNGYMVGKQQVDVKYSKLVVAVCELLQKESFIGSFEQKGNKIEVNLKYNAKSPAISNVKRISKPGLRIYKSSKALPFVLNGLGIAIISTSVGVMSEKEARKKGVGGEVLAEVW